MKLTRNRIACIGEVMIELQAGEGDDAKLKVAGDTYNAAVYMVRALAGRAVSVDYMTVLGRDGFSERILRHMADSGVGTAAVGFHPQKIPGLYAIETDERGERSFTYWRSDSAARRLFSDSDREPLEALAPYGLIFLSGISLAILPRETRDRLAAALDRYRAGGGLVAFDSNYRAHLWNDRGLAQRETARFWRRTDIALPSLDDEVALFGDGGESAVLERLKGCGIARGALKRSDRGPLDLGGRAGPDFRRAEVVVDTTAAGDSFNAGYLAALVTGASPADAMVAGHELALRVIGKRGAIVALDDWP